VLLPQTLRQFHLWVFQLLALLGQGEVVGSQREDGWLEGREPGTVFLLVVGENCPELLIDKLVIAFLVL
jgi:hypothetical protein